MRAITITVLVLGLSLSLFAADSFAKNYYPMTPSQKHFTAEKFQKRSMGIPRINVGSDPSKSEITSA